MLQFHLETLTVWLETLPFIRFVRHENKEDRSQLRTIDTSAAVHHNEGAFVLFREVDHVLVNSFRNLLARGHTMSFDETVVTRAHSGTSRLVAIISNATTSTVARATICHRMLSKTTCTTDVWSLGPFDRYATASSRCSTAFAVYRVIARRCSIERRRVVRSRPDRCSGRPLVVSEDCYTRSGIGTKKETVDIDDILLRLHRHTLGGGRGCGW